MGQCPKFSQFFILEASLRKERQNRKRSKGRSVKLLDEQQVLEVAKQRIEEERRKKEEKEAFDRLTRWKKEVTLRLEREVHEKKEADMRMLKEKMKAAERGRRKEC